MRLRHNNIEYDVLVDSPVTSNYSEELDSATVLIQSQTNKIDFEIMDEVYLFDEYSNYHFIISSINETELNPSDPHYDYQLGLVSVVKELEGYPCPNLRITKTRLNRPIWHYIYEYVNLYGPKIRDENDDIVNKYEIDSAINTKFDVLCPEMQWNRPTLREVLTDLMMVEDCIPIITIENKLSFLDLTERKDDEITNILKIHSDKSLDDYATEIEMELQNVIQDSEDGVYNLTNAVEYTGVRNYDRYDLNTQTALIKTKNSIYDIKHLWFSFDVLIDPDGGSNWVGKHIEVDLCDLMPGHVNLVKEYREFLTKPVRLKIDNGSGDVIDTWTEMEQYQNFCLYYNRGGNSIENLFSDTKRFAFVVDIRKSNLELYIETILGLLYPNYTWNNDTQSEWDNLISYSFKIEYQCLDNTKFKSGKYLPYQNKRTIIDNQTNSLVNASRQGILEYLKINRLGNKTLIIEARYDNLSEVSEVGSVYGDDYVVFKRDVKINPNYVEVVYYATKHYILKDYFTAVKAKIRSWRIDDENMQIRNELHKYYYEFSFDNAFSSDILPVSSEVMLQSPLLNHYEELVLKYSMIRSQIAYGEYLPKNPYRYILTELNSKMFGNSIVLNTELEDNYSNGVAVTDDHWDITTGRLWLESDVSYVDSDGETRALDLYLCDSQNIDISENQFVMPDEFYTDYGKLRDTDRTIKGEFEEVYRRKPLATANFLSGTAYHENFEMYKDQREIPALTLQLEYCSDTPDIVVGSQFVKDHRFISSNYRGGYTLSETVTGELASLNVYVEGSITISANDYHDYCIVVKLQGNSYYVYKSVLSTAVEPATWIWQQQGSANDAYFSFGNEYYQFDSTAHLFKQVGTPNQYNRRTDLRMYYSDEKVRVYDNDFLPDDKTLCSSWNFSFDNEYPNKMTITLGTVSNANAYYITDSEDRVLLSFNHNGTGDSEVIYLNGYQIREITSGPKYMIKFNFTPAYIDRVDVVIDGVTKTLYDPGFVKADLLDTYSWTAYSNTGYHITSGRTGTGTVTQLINTVGIFARLSVYTLTATVDGGTVLFYQYAGSQNPISTAEYNSTIFYVISPDTGFNPPSHSSDYITVNSNNFTLDDVNETAVIRSGILPDCIIKTFVFTVYCYNGTASGSYYNPHSQTTVPISISNGGYQRIEIEYGGTYSFRVTASEGYYYEQRDYSGTVTSQPNNIICNALEYCHINVTFSEGIELITLRLGGSTRFFRASDGNQTVEAKQGLTYEWFANTANAYKYEIVYHSQLSGTTAAGNLPLAPTTNIKTYILRTLNASEHGTVEYFDGDNPNPIGLTPVSYGTVVFAVITPDSGYTPPSAYTIINGKAYIYNLTVNDLVFSMTPDSNIANKTYDPCEVIKYNMTWNMDSGISGIHYQNNGGIWYSLSNTGSSRTVRLDYGTITWYAVPNTDYYLQAFIPTENNPETFAFTQDTTKNVTSVMKKPTLTLYQPASNRPRVNVNNILSHSITVTSVIYSPTGVGQSTTIFSGSQSITSGSDYTFNGLLPAGQTIQSGDTVTVTYTYRGNTYTTSKDY